MSIQEVQESCDNPEIMNLDDFQLFSVQVLFVCLLIAVHRAKRETENGNASNYLRFKFLSANRLATDCILEIYA